MQWKGQARPPASQWAQGPGSRALALRTVCTFVRLSVFRPVHASVCPPFLLLWDEDGRGAVGATARRSSSLTVTSHMLGAQQCNLCSVWGRPPPRVPGWRRRGAGRACPGWRELQGDSLSRFPGCSASAGEGILTLPRGEPWGQMLRERSQRRTKMVWFQLYVVLGSADS